MRRPWHTRMGSTGNGAQLSTTQKALGKSPYKSVPAAIIWGEREPRSREQHVRIVSVDDAPAALCRERFDDLRVRRRQHEIRRVSVEEVAPSVPGREKVEMRNQELRPKCGLVAAVEAHLDAR